MIEKKIISSDVSVMTEEEGERLDSFLLNATLRENTEYAKALTELFGPIDNPRYILMERTFLKKGNIILSHLVLPLKGRM